MGDPLFITRYLLVNTKCLTLDERTVHRVMLGAGAKLPLGRHDMTCHGEEVDTDQQPGSGSVDLIASAEYMVRRGRYGASLSLIGRYNNANEAEHRLGHGLCAAVEAFRRWDLGTDWKLMPSLGMYHELSGKDALDGNTIEAPAVPPCSPTQESACGGVHGGSHPPSSMPLRVLWGRTWYEQRTRCRWTYLQPCKTLNE